MIFNVFNAKHILVDPISDNWYDYTYRKYTLQLVVNCLNSKRTRLSEKKHFDQSIDRKD